MATKKRSPKRPGQSLVRWLGIPQKLAICALLGAITTGILASIQHQSSSGPLDFVLYKVGPSLALALFWLSVGLLVYTVLILIKNLSGEWADDLHKHKWNPIIHDFERYFFKGGLLVFVILYSYSYFGYELELLQHSGRGYWLASWLATTVSLYAYFIVGKLLRMRFI